MDALNKWMKKDKKQAKKAMIEGDEGGASLILVIFVFIAPFIILWGTNRYIRLHVIDPNKKKRKITNLNPDQTFMYKFTGYTNIDEFKKSETYKTRLKNRELDPETLFRSFLNFQQSNVYYKYNKDDQTRLFTDLLETAGEKFDSYKIKTFPDQDHRIDLRGTYNEFPVKITLNKNGLDFSITCKVNNSILGASFNYDESKIPSKIDKDDPFADDDKVFVFFSRGLYVENTSYALDPTIALWESLSEKLQKMITQVLSKHEYQELHISRGEIITRICGYVRFLKSGKPVTILTDISELAASMAKEIEMLDVSVNKQTKAKKRYRLVSCGYCGSKYPLTGSAKCVNCGASYE